MVIKEGGAVSKNFEERCDTRLFPADFGLVVLDGLENEGVPGMGDMHVTGLCEVHHSPTVSVSDIEPRLLTRYLLRRLDSVGTSKGDEHTAFWRAVSESG